MTHLKGAVWTERLLLVLILASLGGTLNLVLAVHRRVNAIGPVRPAEAVAQPAPPVAPTAPQLANSPRPTPPADTPGPNPAPLPPVPAEDPTAKVLARMDGAIARERDAAGEADRRTASLEAAIHNSVVESQRWKRREMLVRQQVAKLNRKADQLEQTVMTEDAERDVLARERDALKAATVKASQKSGYSVLPYKGPNGTWRRPIVLECSGNTVKLLPGGKTFSMLELSPLINPRSSPVILAIAREMLHIQQSETPDGAPAVPYLVFLVRPDGIRPYYQARGRLESLGVAFGYELIEQDLVVDVPDFDDVKTWDGTVSLDVPELANNGANASRGWPPSGEAQEKSNAGGSPASAGGDRTVAGGPPALGAWPPAVEGDAKAGSDRGWPDLARGNAAPGRTGTGSNASDGGMTGPSAALNESGGNATRGRRVVGESGQAGDGSPDDFVWPSSPGEGRPGGGRGEGGSGRGTADYGGTGPVVAGMPTGGPSGTDPSRGSPPGTGGTGPGSGSGGTGPGTSASGTPDGPIGSAAGSSSGGAGDAPALGAGFGSMGSSHPGEGSGSSGTSAIGQPGADLSGGGGPLSPGRFSVAGRGTGSPSGGAMSRGANNTAAGTGSGPGLAKGDPLPDLEPAQDGASPSGSKTGGLSSSPGAGGSGGPDLGGLGPGTSATDGGPSNASARPGSQTGSDGGGPVASGGGGQPPSAGSGPYAAAGGGQPGSAQGGQSASGSGGQPKPASGQPGGGTPPAGKDGTDPPDIGFAPYAGGPSAPPTDGATPSSGGGGDLAANAPASAGGSGPGAATDTSQSGPGTAASSGSGGSTQQAGNPGTTGPLAGTRSSTSTSTSTTATGPQVSSLNANATSTASANGGVPPSSFQSALASASPSTASALANAFGGGSTGNASGSLSDAMGSMAASPSTPSSSSSSSSGGDSGGQPQTPMPPGASGMSLPSLNLNPSPDSEPDALKELALPPIDTHRQPGRIDVPFEIVVVCRRNDVLLHPGGYRITTQTLRDGAAKGKDPDGLLKRELRTLVRRRAQVDPLIRPKPRLKFLVETGGGTTFWTAQQQLIFSGLDWPMAVQVAGPQSQTAQLLGEGTRR